MTASEYNNVEDVYAVARELCARLMIEGEELAAKELDDTMATFWTTASEALGEIKLSLLKARSTVEKTLGRDALGLLDNAVDGATKLWLG